MSWTPSAATGEWLLPSVADVRSPDEVAALVAACEERLGPPDIVVANAGVATRHPTTHMAPADFAAIVAVNLGGVQNLFAAVIAGMCNRGGGRLLATSSTSGVLHGWTGHAAYCAAKAGITGLVKTYAAEFGAHGITANAVAPGVIRSPQASTPSTPSARTG